MLANERLSRRPERPRSGASPGGRSGRARAQERPGVGPVAESGPTALGRRSAPAAMVIIIFDDYYL